MKPMSLTPPFEPSPAKEVREAFHKLGLSSKDVLFEPGCGDARILILAAKEFGARGIGYELADEIFVRAKKNVERNNLQTMITLRKESFYNLREEDLEKSTIAYLYLSDLANQILEPVLIKYSLKILSREFSLFTVQGRKITDRIWFYDCTKPNQITCQFPRIAKSLLRIK
jgi:hypothetical protein